MIEDTTKLTDKFDRRIETYKRKYQIYGYSEKSLEMPSDRRNIRYFELIKNFDFYRKKDRTFFSILDAGCGFGDINAYFNQIQIFDYKYMGIDVVDEFIKIAQEKYGNKDIKFQKRNFIEESIDDLNFDYAISSQTFNDPYTDEEGSNYSVIFSTIEKLFTQCNKGVSFNFVTNRGDSLKQGIAYHDPIKIMEFAYSLSKHVIMDNSCMPYECTCTIMKDNSIMNGKLFESFTDIYREEFEKKIFIIKGN